MRWRWPPSKPRGRIFDAKRLWLTVTLPPHPRRPEADPTRLTQVLGNLLDNAAKFTDPGGRVWLSAEPEGKEVVLRVRDTGIGIPPEVLPHVCESFTQADRTLERPRGGLDRWFQKPLDPEKMLAELDRELSASA
jgi:signal transduction histidine kinase